MSRVPDVPQLTGLRAVGAIWVLACHSLNLMITLWPPAEHLRGLALGGNLGVDLFFVLSGFIITLNYLDVLGRWSWWGTAGFLGLRLARVYPVFLVMSVAWAVYFLVRTCDDSTLTDSVLSARNVVMNVLLLNHVPPSSSIASISWSVCLEMGAYLAFPLLALLLIRLRSAIVAWLLAIAVTAAGLFRLDQLDVHGFGFFSYQAGWTRLAMQFLTGCLLCVAWQRSGRWRQGLHWDAAGFAAAVFIVIACLAEDIHHVGFFPYAAVPCLALVVVSCAGATGPLRYVFSTRPVVWLGRVSYSLYMTHTLTLALATLAIGRIWSSHPPSDFMRGATPVLVYVAVIAVAALVFHLVEEPARRGLRRAIGSRRVAA
ncbi:acyltransferase [Aeromicrobium sp. NPDC092404]|uniref:acyltransferase family protein n=1 Tax=Aeromicrobium sp. NPDC092404 TaxID=3154976 RepID=UPI0034428984